MSRTKHNLAGLLSVAVILLGGLNLTGNAAEKKALPDISKALKKGAQFLLSTQAPDGSWGHHPAITALAVMAIVHTPGIPPKKLKTAIDKGMKYTLSFIQKDGSIYPADRDRRESANYPNYTTAISLLAMATLHRPEYEEKMRAARRYLQRLQFNDPSKVDFGGIGYGHTGRADLSNASLAAEALYFTDYLDKEPLNKDPEAAKRTKKMWKNLQTFLTKCQNLPEINKQPYVSTNPDDRGGFIYRPFESKAGSRGGKGKTSALISSGSMTYAGLKSMIYSQIKASDPRVKGAIRYLMAHYTLSKNPGMGQQGRYYYLHTMAKALDAYGVDALKDANGNIHYWRKDMINTLLKLQRADGSWVNAQSRFFESVPDLVTAYCLIALKIADGRGELQVRHDKK